MAVLREEKRESCCPRRVRTLVDTTKIIKRDFRVLFGLLSAHKCGYFVDRYLSAKIHSFSDWLDYADGNHVLRGHTRELYCMSISDDGQYLYTSGSDCMIIVWNLLNPTHPSRTFEWMAHREIILGLTSHIQSGLLISCSLDSTVRIWINVIDEHNNNNNNDHSYRLMKELNGHYDSVWTVDINQKGDLIVSGSSDHSLRIWSVVNGECLGILVGHTQGLCDAMFLRSDNNDDSLIISSADDLTVRVWDYHIHGYNSADDCHSTKIKQIRCVNESFDGAYECSGLIMNCDCSLIAVTYDNSSLFKALLMRWPDFKVMSDILNRRTQDFHPKLPHILVVDSPILPIIEIYDLKKGECIHVLKGHDKLLEQVRFVPDGTRLISVSNDRTARVWDLSDLRYSS